MPSRREFLHASAALTAGAFYRGEFPESIEAEPQQAGPLPPSIAALTSMRDRATPISVEERRARIEKARRLMREQSLNGMLLTGGTTLVYFTGIRWGLSERMLALIVPVSGRAFLVCPALEEERAREQVQDGPLAGDVDFLTWEEDQSPYALVADGMKARGAAAGRLGIEETVRHVFSDGVARAAPSLTLASATAVTAGCRAVKDAHELALMRLASEVTLKAYEAAYRALKEGMTQDQFADLVSQAHRRLGFTGEDQTGATMLLQIFSYGADPLLGVALGIVTALAYAEAFIARVAEREADVNMVTSRSTTRCLPWRTGRGPRRRSRHTNASGTKASTATRSTGCSTR